MRQHIVDLLVLYRNSYRAGRSPKDKREMLVGMTLCLIQLDRIQLH